MQPMQLTATHCTRLGHCTALRCTAVAVAVCSSCTATRPAPLDSFTQMSTMMRSALPLTRSVVAQAAARTSTRAAAAVASLQPQLQSAVRPQQQQARLAALRPMSASFATAASAATSAPAAAAAATAGGSPQGTFSSIPVIDLTGTFGPGPAAESRRRAVANEIDAAARNVGFFTIVGHGVDEAAIANVWKITQSYFDLPEAKKNEIQMDKEYPYGQCTHPSSHAVG